MSMLLVSFLGCLKVMLCEFMQESKSIGAEVNWGVRFKDVKNVGILML